MNTKLDQQSLTVYRQRWQAVAAVEDIERQSSSTTERWRQLNALFHLAVNLNILPLDQDTKLDEGRQQWQALYLIVQNNNP